MGPYSILDIRSVGLSRNSNPGKFIKIYMHCFREAVVPLLSIGLLERQKDRIKHDLSKVSSISKIVTYAEIKLAAASKAANTVKEIFVSIACQVQFRKKFKDNPTYNSGLLSHGLIIR